MSKYTMPPFHIGNLVARTPIIQGGMGVGISLSGLAAAVAEQGGIGVISAVGLSLIHPHTECSLQTANLMALRDEIQAARKLTRGIIGLNIMVALSDYDYLLQTALEEQVDVVFLGAGLPVKQPATITPEQLRSTATKLAVIVSSDRAAQLIFSSWAKKFDRVPDAVVVEGPRAGGHLGFKKEQIFDPAYSLESILPGVINAVGEYERDWGVRVPVIAAGGVYTGEDIYRFMQMGAAGVQMGTRFVATNECDASAAFKQKYVDCREEDIIIIDSPVGLPGRAIRNKYLDDVVQGLKHTITCRWKCLKSCEIDKAMYCIAKALANARKGLLDDGFAFAGANAFLVNQIVSVKDLIDSLIAEYRIAAMNSDGLQAV